MQDKGQRILLEKIVNRHKDCPCVCLRRRLLMGYQPLRRTPAEELEKRIHKLQEMMKGKDLDGAIIMQNADLFYFAGTVQRSHLFIPAEGEPVLLVKRSYDRAVLESTLNDIRHFRNLKELPGMIESHLGYRANRIGFELDVVPAAFYLNYQRLLKPVQITDISNLIRQVRSVKSPYEIETLRGAAELNRTMLSHVSGFLQEGMTEIELSSKLEGVFRREGHQGFVRTRSFNMEVFYGHLMSGWNLAVPTFMDGATGGSGLNVSFPQGAGFKKIERNEPIIVDYVGILDGYMVDQTRVFCIGQLSAPLVYAYDVSIEIQEMVKEMAKPGVSCADVYDLALKMAVKHGLKDHFMGYQDPVSFIAHGIGIELDEIPVIAKGYDVPLKEGMVLALEPKFVFPDGAVGIENTLLVTPQGLETLTVLDDNITYLP